MPLIHCPDCQASISPRAWRCPRCGAPHTTRRRAVLRRIALIPLWAIVIGVAGLTLFLVIFVATEPARAERQQREAVQARADAEWQRLRDMIQQTNAVARESAARH